jgi:hypothetical protein
MPRLNEAGELRDLQLLINLTPELSWESIPVAAKFNKHGQPLQDKFGNYDVKFTKKQVQKHLFIIVREKDDIRNFLLFFGYDPNEYTFEVLPEFPADMVVDVEPHEMMQVDTTTDTDADFIDDETHG